VAIQGVATEERNSADDIIKQFEGRREELGAWVPRGWRRSTTPLDMASTGVDGEMEEALQDTAAERGTLSVSSRRRI
jgi:hypothetical protein